MICLVTGTILISFNIYGLFFSLRPHDINELGIFKKDVDMTFEKSIDQLKNVEKKDNLEYIVFLNRIVNRTMAHEWRVRNESDYLKNRYTIPIWENWLLFSLSYIKPNIFKKYFIVDPYKGLERGVGWCSQHAEVLKGIMIDKNIKAELLGLGGHTVVSGEIGTHRFIADPDYGVVLPFSLEEVGNRLDTLRYYYGNVENDYKFGVKDYLVEDLIRIYGNENNIYSSDETVSVGSKYRVLEKASYILKWLFPIVLVSIFLIQKRNKCVE